MTCICPAPSYATCKYFAHGGGGGGGGARKINSDLGMGHEKRFVLSRVVKYILPQIPIINYDCSLNQVAMRPTLLNFTLSVSDTRRFYLSGGECHSMC